MDEQAKQAYLEKYKKEKEKGVPFFPDALFKDAVVALIIFLILVGLSSFLGVPLEDRANPADTNYNPRPEWYFLFLFQLLKYFPGQFEVVGVVVIPTIAILVLFLLPVLDKRPERHFSYRIWVNGITLFLLVSAISLTYLSIQEIPPPVEYSSGDPTALLYADNCAGCHGTAIEIDPNAAINLHEIITQGSHEGMPAWSADLTNDEVDALAGFILSPAGSEVFFQNCAECHDSAELVSNDPLELKSVLDDGRAFPAHVDQSIKEWKEELTREERTALLNFLSAPDGKRLFAVNCAPCHGRAVSSADNEEELRALIAEGGLHLEMPAWQEKLASADLDTLARFVVEPASAPTGQALFDQECTSCHGERVPSADSFEEAREIIATGGSHETMPVWGEVLTSEQLDALVAYTLSTAGGSVLEIGQELFEENCTSCHGDFGEGGENPSRPDDIIAPISTAEYLKTRDDHTIQLIISQGQPNFGMSPFSSAFGGPLDDDQVDALVAYIRSWEDDPPVELPPDVIIHGDLSLEGSEIFDALCYQCHGPTTEGFRQGPSLAVPDFQEARTDQEIFDSINLGHEATSMIAWGEILTSEQIAQLVDFIRNLPPEDSSAVGISFKRDVYPILESRCARCHAGINGDGGWDATTYEGVVDSGDNGPVVIPGDPDNSLLAQKLLGTQQIGDPMPPLITLSERKIQVILDWIINGAPNN